MISDDRQTWHVDLTPKYNRSDLVKKKPPFADEKRRKHYASDIPILYVAKSYHTQIYLKIVIVHSIIGDPSSTQMTHRTIVRSSPISARHSMHVIIVIIAWDWSISFFRLENIDICLISPQQNIFIKPVDNTRRVIYYAQAFITYISPIS